MKRLLLVLAMAMFMAIMTGCAGTLPTNSYTPQNYVRTDGRVDIGNFEYLPLKTDKHVKKPNQLQNTAAGQIYLASNVADYVKRGNALELEKTGIILDINAPIRLNANIIEFMLDDLGYSVDIKYQIQYIIEEKAGNKIVFDKIFATKPQKIGKFGDASDYANVVSDTILAGYDMFIREPSVQHIFRDANMPPMPQGKAIKK